MQFCLVWRSTFLKTQVGFFPLIFQIIALKQCRLGGQLVQKHHLTPKMKRLRTDLLSLTWLLNEKTNRQQLILFQVVHSLQWLTSEIWLRLCNLLLFAKSYWWTKIFMASFEAQKAHQWIRSCLCLFLSQYIHQDSTSPSLIPIITFQFLITSFTLILCSFLL